MKVNRNLTQAKDVSEDVKDEPISKRRKSTHSSEEDIARIIRRSKNFHYFYSEDEGCNFFIITIGLKLDNDKIINWEDLNSCYKRLKKDNEINPAVIKAYKYLKHQRQPCQYCKVISTALKQKYILSCYCTFCQDCLETEVRKIIEPVLNNLKIKKEVYDDATGITFKRNLPKCLKHKIPFFVERTVELFSVKKLHELAINNVELFNVTCNLY